MVIKQLQLRYGNFSVNCASRTTPPQMLHFSVNCANRPVQAKMQLFFGKLRYLNDSA